MTSRAPRLTIGLMLGLTSLLLVGSCGGAGEPPNPTLVPPTVLDRFPANGAVGVVLLPTVRVWFDQRLDPASVTTESVWLEGPGGGTVPSTCWTRDHDGHTDHEIALTPATPLEALTSYTLHLTTGVANLAGLPLVYPFTTQFETVAPSATRSWQAPVTFENHGGEGRLPALAVADEGTALAVWLEQGDPRVDLWRRVFDPATGWGEPERCAFDMGVFEAPDIAMNAAGYGMVAAPILGGVGEPGHRLWVCNYLPSAGWGPARFGDESLVPVRYPCAAVDGQGNGYAAWESMPKGGGEKIATAILRMAAVAAPTVTTLYPLDISHQDTSVHRPQLVVNETGMAYHLPTVEVPADVAGPARTFLFGQYFVWPGLGLGEATGGGVRYDLAPWPTPSPAVGIDADGFVTVLFVDGTEVPSRIFAQRWSRADGRLSETELTAGLEGHGTNPHLAVGRDGRVLAVWEQTLASGDHAIACSWFSEAEGWHDAATLVATHRVQSEPRAAIGPLGDAIVVWHDIGDVQASHHQGGKSWSAPTVLSTYFSTEEVSRPRVAIDGVGRALAIWEQYEWSPPRWTVRAARFE